MLGAERRLQLKPEQIKSETQFSMWIPEMTEATGVGYRDLWEFRAHALRRGVAPAGLFIWMIWHAERAKRYVTQADEDAARKHVKDYEAQYA